MKAEKQRSEFYTNKKSKKELGVDGHGIQKTMRYYHYLGDGLAQIAYNSITGLVAMLTYFYTDKIGLAAGTVGTMMLVTKIFDAFSDLGMGKLVDITKSKYGKARPWLLWTAIPTMLAIILLFTVPANASDAVKNTYAFITILFVNAVILTAIAIPYGSMMAMRTRSSEERGKMGIIRTVFGYFIGMAIAVALIPFTNFLGGDQRAWIIVAIILGIISAISLLITFFASKEVSTVAGKNKEEKAEEKNIPFWTSLKLLFKNKYWVIMLVAQLIINIVFALSGSTGVYYAKYIIGDENLVAIMGAIGIIPVIIGFAILAPLIKKFGPAKTVRIGLVIGIVASIIRCFFPYSFMATLVLGAFTTFATIPIMALTGVLTNNTVEYGQWKHGKRIVGMTNSATSYGAKVGNGVGVAMVGWILAFGSYNGTLEVQPQSAIYSILTLTIYIPLICFIITYFLLRKYDLDQKYPQIVKDLEKTEGAH
ncbi:glycoside/pentoside/hexuronide:cation symporter, GPH family [Evansella caseinilytica]|uniref:Glycoside/pentoside/hexuronide:cation symporter, GPH family n=1 Tax=Evansella caseinilytica TaxID=1503961 RepID=A0A1H3I4E2_9BACI|nr:glycoside-pentoside-hexuronide (GPH):cation symporter [Evansella caseinilytica]SDY21988.1 glycoside/pentoside/hexuronide:cation symporter, GPH family [Evansella caseinilytica]